MKGWSNETPCEDGHYWIVEQQFDDEKLIKTFGPSVGYVTIKPSYMNIDWIGSDDPGALPVTNPMVTERVCPRDPIFGWDNEDEAARKRKDAVTRKWVYWVRPIPNAYFSEKHPVPAYPVIHQEGLLSIEKAFSTTEHHCDLGIQVAPDGRIWVCVNGDAYIRFKPISKETYETLYLAAVKAAVVKGEDDV